MALKTPNITTDCTAKFSFPVEGEADYNEKQLRTVDGTHFGWRESSKKLRKWRFDFPLLEDSQYDDLITFLDARGGGATRFYFDHAKTGENDIPVRMVKGSFRDSWYAPNAWSASFEVEEVAS